MQGKMKKILYSVLGLCIMMPVVSCQKENVNSADLGKEIRGERTSFVAVAENAVKTTIQDSDKEAADYGKVSWAVGDQVKFVYETHEGTGDKTPGYQNSDALTAEDIVEGAATFTADLPAGIKAKVGTGEAHLYAVYPATIDVDYHDGSTFKMTVPATQDGTFANASIALAKLDRTAVDAPLEFKNFCGLFRVTTTDANVRKLVVASKTDIAGLVNVTFTGPAVKAIVEGKKEITVNVNGAGTYYVAVLPGALDGVNVYAYNESGALIGDASTSNTISLARAQMRSMGTIGSSSYYFVKVEAAGAKDGSSWDNAADYTGLRTKLMANNTELKVFIAGGTYTAAEASMGSTNTSCVNVIKGGYPSDATGYSLAGRDCKNNETILDGGNNNRIWILQVGSWNIDGVTFANAKRGSDKSDTGSALVIEAKSGSFNVTNSKFNDNVNETTGGGAVRVSGGTVNMINCEFTGNKAENTGTSKGQGGAIFVGATGTLKAEKCLFTSNAAKAAMGAIHVAGELEMRDCSFIDNNQSSVALSGKGKAYIDNSYFTYTADNGKPNAIISPAASTTEVRINNSVLTGNWGGNGNYQIYGPGNVLVVNTTMLGQIGAGNIGVAAGGKINVINSIVGNAASSGVGKSFAANEKATADCSYTLYSTLSGPVTVASSLEGIKYTTDANKNFPVGYTWYKTNATAMFTNNQSSTLAVSDCREKLHFYKWDGMTPTIDEKIFTKATLDQIRALVTTADADFAIWLGNSLGKDIRGVSRDESAMWPGSYQEAGSTKAGLDNFNVK